MGREDLPLPLGRRLFFASLGAIHAASFAVDGSWGLAWLFLACGLFLVTPERDATLSTRRHRR